MTADHLINTNRSATISIVPSWGTNCWGRISPWRQPVTKWLSMIIMVKMEPMWQAWEPKSTGVAERKSTGDAVPKSTDDAEPKSTGDAVPKSTDDAEPKSTDDVEPKSTGDAEPKSTGDAEPKSMGDAEPKSLGDGADVVMWFRCPDVVPMGRSDGTDDKK
ncbi:unnamed protein product [Arabis nemorensis]|uniref:Uncharacterized protein n=1 Tax=Arabis nemorensis TaxID=586526 RepID=A0A565AUK9_9BRAS|nr:unnamed protein product [Arabis nemorensis]